MASEGAPEGRLPADIHVEVSDTRPRVTFAASPTRGPSGSPAAPGVQVPPSSCAPQFTAAGSASSAPYIAPGLSDGRLLHAAGDSAATIDQQCVPPVE